MTAKESSRIDREAMLKDVAVYRAGIPGRSAVVYDTRLDRYLYENEVLPTRLAAEARIARQALRLYRAAVQEPTRPVMARIVLGLRALTGRDVKAADLWYLGESQQDTLPESQRTTEIERRRFRSAAAVDKQTK